MAIMFAALSTRLWFLQVLATEVYADEAQNNSVRTAKTDALRGEIWTSDQFAKEEAGRRATPLVTNRKSLEVRVNKQELIESGRAEQVLLRLSEMLDIRVEEINDKLADKQYFDYQPKPIAEFVDEEVRFYIEEHAEQFPGVEVVDASVRVLPHGHHRRRTCSGWVGQIDGDQVEQDAYKNYGNSDLVGKTGVELTYEKWLRGRKGVQRYVVNSDGETIRNLGEVDPTPGDNLVLTVDSEVQKSSEAALQEGMERGPHDLR